ncbi:hypothetical protein E05_46950 [Plautia stali symbiont]|nr:hypothetical protein E05_46950 [Plautia stali symbiont]
MGLDQQVVAALPELGHGLLMTLVLTVLASLVSVVMGQLGCFLQLRRAWIWRAIGRFYVSVMRGTPAIVQLFVVFFTLPRLGLGGQPMLAAVIAIGLNSGAYVAEILRVNRKPGDARTAGSVAHVGPEPLADVVVRHQSTGDARQSADAGE